MAVIITTSEELMAYFNREKEIAIIYEELEKHLKKYLRKYNQVTPSYLLRRISRKFTSISRKDLIDVIINILMKIGAVKKQLNGQIYVLLQK